MSVCFEMRVPPGHTEAIEYIVIPILAFASQQKDVVNRAATDEDRVQWAEAYAAFKASLQTKQEVKAAEQEAKHEAQAEAKEEKAEAKEEKAEAKEEKKKSKFFGK